MPAFLVILKGAGVADGAAGGVAAMVGFYATRLVRARDHDEAGVEATARVRSAWSRAHRGAVPALAVERAVPVGWWRALLLPKPAGFLLHDDDGTDGDAG
jgi:hypothetical protein